MKSVKSAIDWIGRLYSAVIAEEFEEAGEKVEKEKVEEVEEFVERVEERWICSHYYLVKSHSYSSNNKNNNKSTGESSFSGEASELADLRIIRFSIRSLFVLSISSR